MTTEPVKNKPRNHARNTQSLAETIAQREEMYLLRCDGWTVTDIAKKFGCSAPNVTMRIKRHRDSLPEEERADRRKDIDALYRKQLRRVEEIIAYGPIPAYSHGRPIVTKWDADNQPTEYALDFSYVLKGMDTSLKILADIRKMYGLDEATKIEQSGEVTLKLVGVDVSEL